MNRSGAMLEQIEESIQSTEQAYASLLETSKTQRSLSLAAIGFAIDEDKFLNESAKEIQDSDSKFKNYLAVLKTKKESNQEISRKDLIKLTMLAEDHYQQSLSSKDQSWDNANDNFHSVISSYSENQTNIKYMQIFSLFSLIFIVMIFMSREKVKRTMKEKDRLHSQLFSSLLEGVFLCNKEGTVIACNSSGALIAGKDLNKLMGKDIGTLFKNMDIRTQKQKKLVSSEYFKSIISKNKTIFGKTIAVTGKSGFTNWYNFNAQPFISINNDQSTMLLSFSNVTEKIHAQNTIKLQQIEIMEGSKLRTIGEMAGGIAHEIDNPLATIYATTERLELKAERNPEVNSEVVLKSTQKTLKTVRRITAVVKSLLSLSREADVDVQHLQIKEVLDLAMDLAQVELTRTQIEFNLESEALDNVIECYPTQIAQVLLNLTKNAVDALEHEKTKWIKIKIVDDGDVIRFIFADSGKGLRPDVANKILLPFFTTKEVGKGTGLGLSISRSIIASHGGEIYVDMNAPTTTFVFTISKKYPKDNEDDFKVAS